MNMSARLPIAATVSVIALLATVLALSATAAETTTSAAPVARPAGSEAKPPVTTATSASTSTTAAPPKKPMETVRMMAFKLKDGRAISGRVVSDDRGQVTVAEAVGGKITPTSYPRQDMEPRSINYQTVSEYQYWMNTGQFFDSHTWDFVDDADEFAQALRSFQNARDLAVSGMGPESAAAIDADTRVKKVLESRQRWIETAKPRAEMAELEVKSTLVQRLESINRALASLQANMEVLNQSKAAMDVSYAAFQRETVARMDRMTEEIRNITYYTGGGVVVTPTPTPMPYTNP
jgi:hypothetical protein